MLKSSINSRYAKHNGIRIYQGDLLRDFSFQAPRHALQEIFEYTFPYALVISQDCDLEQGQKSIEESLGNGNLPLFNQYLPNILITPAFVLESIRDGDHLRDVFNILTQKLGGDKLRQIKQNQVPRYHFLEHCSEFNIPDLVIDFKIVFSVDLAFAQQKAKNCYLATVNELFREALLQRYSFYSSRIGLPDLNEATNQKA